MERILRFSTRKLLAFVLAVALAVTSLAVLLPTVTKAGEPIEPITDVTIELGKMPEVGAKVESVVSEGATLTANGQGFDSEIPANMGYMVSTWDATTQDYVYQLIEGDDIVFNETAQYRLFVELTAEQSDKLSGDFVKSIEGIAPGYVDYVQWSDSGSMALVYDFSFHTVSFDSAGGSEVDPIYAITGSYIAIPTAPTKAGYEFWAWWSNEKEDYFDFEEDYIIHNIELDANWLASTLEGDGQTFYLESDNDLAIRWDANKDDLQTLELYNVTTGEPIDMDENCYSLTDGSTILTLKNSFLKTLAAGDYSLSASFKDTNDDWSVAFATFSVVEGAAPVQSTTPQTGDNSNLVEFVSIAGAATLGLATVVALRKKVSE